MRNHLVRRKANLVNTHLGVAVDDDVSVKSPFRDQLILSSGAP
jgi:hypothetical protein